MSDDDETIPECDCDEKQSFKSIKVTDERDTSRPVRYFSKTARTEKVRRSKAESVAAVTEIPPAREAKALSSVGRNVSDTPFHGINYTYEVVEDIADFLMRRTQLRPKIGIILGSGLNSVADTISNPEIFEYRDIPNFPITTVEGHMGRLIFGDLEGSSVMVMQGRFHHFEGYTVSKCAMPVRVMKLIGIQYLLITNGAGSINPNYKVGDIMIIRDHINLPGFAGNSPLAGRNDERFGPRFPSMANAYNPHLVNIAKSAAKDMGIEGSVHEGVYTCLGGPTYETVAELRMLQVCGADAVGMSTVHEVIFARHCHLTVFAFSLITHNCALDYEKTVDFVVDHKAIEEVGKKNTKICDDLLCRVIREINRLSSGAKRGSQIFHA